MAQLTRAQARTMVQNLIDDTAAKLWAAADLDILAEATIDELWGELLDQFPWVRSTETGPLPMTLPGTINLATGLSRFYRLQKVVRNGSPIFASSQREVVISNSVAISAASGTYTIMGDLLYLFPLSMTQDVFVQYANRPTSFTSLATDATAVDWPDGYHFAYIYDIAARAMEKGDREKSDRFAKRASDSLFRLKAYLRKQSPEPVMPATGDDARAWGSIT